MSGACLLPVLECTAKSRSRAENCAEPWMNEWISETNKLVRCTVEWLQSRIKRVVWMCRQLCTCVCVCRRNLMQQQQRRRRLPFSALLKTGAMNAILSTCWLLRLPRLQRCASWTATEKREAKNPQKATSTTTATERERVCGKEEKG